MLVTYTCPCAPCPQNAEALKRLREGKAGLRQDLEKQAARANAAESSVRALKRELAKAEKAMAAVGALTQPAAPPPPTPKPAPKPAPKPVPPSPAGAATVALKTVAKADGKVRLAPGVATSDVLVVTGAATKIGRLLVGELLASYPDATVRATARSADALDEALAGLPTDRLQKVGTPHSSQHVLPSLAFACLPLPSLAKAVQLRASYVTSHTSRPHQCR